MKWKTKYYVSKRESNRSNHVKFRSAERYGFLLDDGDIAEIKKAIFSRKGKYKLTKIHKQSNSRIIFAAQSSEHIVIVVYDAKHHEICTVLPVNCKEVKRWLTLIPNT